MVGLCSDGLGEVPPVCCCALGECEPGEAPPLQEFNVPEDWDKNDVMGVRERICGGLAGGMISLPEEPVFAETSKTSSRFQSSSRSFSFFFSLENNS